MHANGVNSVSCLGLIFFGQALLIMFTMSVRSLGVRKKPTVPDVEGDGTLMLASTVVA